jgi:hypothetical protein
MTTLTHSGIDNQIMSATSGSSNISECSGDLVLFSGISDALSFSRSIGSAFICSGTDQTLSVAECGIDDSIYDLGKGLNLSFYFLGDEAVIRAAYLQVYGFGWDTAGKVHVIPGQTASVSADGRGGSYLTLGGDRGGIVHFAGDPVANLQAHIV